MFTVLRVLTAALAFCLLFLSPVARAQSSWTFLTEKEGIRVYSRPVTGSKIKALRVECTLNTTLSALVALLLDVPGTTRWVSHTKSCTMLRRVSDAELYYYSEVSLPWPLQNRDFVAHVKVSQDPSTGVVTINAPAVPGMVAPKKGIVRVPRSAGLWTLTPMGRQVKVVYTLQVDPGGALPAWAVNALSSQGPVESFTNMKRMLQQPVYKNAVLGFIRN